MDGRLLVWDCGVVWRLKGEISRPSIATYSPSSSSSSSSSNSHKAGLSRGGFTPLSMCYSNLDSTLFVGSQTGAISAWSLSPSSPPSSVVAKSRASSSKLLPSMWKSRERSMAIGHSGTFNHINTMNEDDY